MSKTSPPDYREETSEHLRLVLPLLAQYASDFGPQSYALWFAFVKSSSAKLTAELEILMARGGRLTQLQTTALYNSHLSDESAQKLENVREAFVQILSDMKTSSDEVTTVVSNGRAALLSLPAAGTSRQSGAAGGDFGQATQLVLESLVSFGRQLSTTQAQMTAMRDELQSVRNEARTDALTKLRNRRAFDESLHQLADEARINRLPLSLIMIDVDSFKQFNDVHGHVMGDKALSTIAAVIQQNVKGKDIAARYGGEEFAVILPDTSLAGARYVAENLRLAVE
ncbi:MAG: GGDEF domain-containing protein, partial [Janthinobacterium lividum]